MESYKRKINLVINGLTEVENIDVESVQKILKELLVDEQVKFEMECRIGNKGDIPRPIRIRIEDIGQRRKLLRGAKGLKNIEGMSKVYISPDLTILQQAEDKDLRNKVAKLKKDVKIYVQISKKGR